MNNPTYEKCIPVLTRVDNHVMKNNRILVIDDEPEIRALLSRFLGRIGFSVLAAGTLKEGRKMFNESQPELVFLDVNLPDGNGLNELKYINSGKLKSKVIMMSAFDHNEVKMEAIQNGALDFLSKPFNIARLDQVVQSQLLNSNNTK
ncbi:response regulator [Algoriphagus chordae]|uniref:Two-component system KDP operon response regulator KdpE n=1 Tax=Algoriphagus chordae TaxID=237019 RepID=A0A2W7STW1_9BACT|nr:response regulator [Algoriphagus chordae]PZX54162.1 two-component system KDP operon response regulator KdpE [Algoriphagus chordae]